MVWRSPAGRIAAPSWCGVWSRSSTSIRPRCRRCPNLRASPKPKRLNWFPRLRETVIFPGNPVAFSNFQEHLAFPKNTAVRVFDLAHKNRKFAHRHGTPLKEVGTHKNQFRHPARLNPHSPTQYTYLLPALTPTPTSLAHRAPRDWNSKGGSCRTRTGSLKVGCSLMVTESNSSARSTEGGRTGSAGADITPDCPETKLAHRSEPR